MNKSNFNQTGGFPLKTERLQELQTSFQIFNAFGNIAGNFTIVEGCETEGSTVKNGKIYINNELLEFREAAVTQDSKVIIIEDFINRAFENGSVKTVHTMRYATFGTAQTSWPWTNFKRPIETKTIPIDLVSRLEILEKKNAVFQLGGGMVLWNKPANQIPAGWQEVVQWRGRMPIGFDSSQPEFNTMSKEGGTKNKRISINEMPAHKHSIAGDPNENHENGSYVIGGGEYGVKTAYTDIRGGAPGATVEGSGQEFSIMNPYRVVLFIEFIG
jgi:hypothetical protein